MANEFNVTPLNTGIEWVDENHYVFPSRRYNNALYGKDDVFQRRFEGAMILGYQSLDEGALFFVRDESGERERFVFRPARNIPYGFDENNNGQVILEIGNRDKRLVRFVDGEVRISKIGFRSAAGLSYNGIDASAFYHVRGNVENSDGSFTYRVSIHLIRSDEDKPRVVENLETSVLRIRLEWVGTDLLRVDYGDKSTEIPIR